jgi:Fe-S oxidoreductase
MKEYLDSFKNCLEKEPPFCRVACPFGLDVIDVIEKLKRGAFRSAYQSYRDAVLFPSIVSEICTEPCKAVCPKAGFGGAIELRRLEEALVKHTENQEPTVYNLPQKEQKVAIIGGGLSGLACALRMATRRYDVTLYEERSRIGGRLWQKFPDGKFMEEIERQFTGLKYNLQLNTKIEKLDDLLGFDAIYIATGQGGSTFDIEKIADSDGHVILEDGPLVALGGGVTGKDDIHALAEGIDKAVILDNYLRSKRIILSQKKTETGTVVDKSKWVTENKVIPQQEVYTEEELKREAARCMECQCDFCMTYCDLPEYLGKWPLRIRDEVAATILPGKTELKGTPAKRLMSSSNLTGICKEVCPVEIDLDGFILEGRKSMHRQGKVPWVFHDFWIRDMDHADSKKSQIAKAPLGEDKCSVAFFPGCQLGASRPSLVDKTYSYIKGKEPSAGLLLRCCGVPAEWAGMEDLHKEKIEEIRRAWKEMGYPLIILACPTCGKKFDEFFPEIPTIFIYEWMVEKGIEREGCLKDSPRDQSYSIFDPCSTRHMPKVHDAVRELVANLGIPLEELPFSRESANCCSFGGQPAIADPEYQQFVVKKRIEEGECPYISYCINCQDVFVAEGKESLHILDLFFTDAKDEDEIINQPTETQRRRNREALKKDLLERNWEEKMTEEENVNPIKLKWEPGVLEKINQQRILEEDILRVIEFCETTKRKVYHAEKKTWSGYREIGFMTYWVEYEEEDVETFLVHNAYSHRMKIELEGVWNGTKRETLV